MHRKMGSEKRFSDNLVSYYTKSFIKHFHQRFYRFRSNADSKEFWIDVVVVKKCFALGGGNQVVVGQVHEGANHGPGGAEAGAFEQAKLVMNGLHGAVQVNGD